MHIYIYTYNIELYKRWRKSWVSIMYHHKLHLDFLPTLTRYFLRATVRIFYLLHLLKTIFTQWMIDYIIT